MSPSPATFNVGMRGIGIAVAVRIGIEHPVEMAVRADDDIRVAFIAEERRQRLRALHDAAAHEDAALRSEIAGNEQIQRVEAHGHQQAHQWVVQWDAGSALVGDI